MPSTIWTDAQTGTLTKEKLFEYSKQDTSIINKEDANDLNGLTPLGKALKAGQIAVVKLLLDNGASVEKKMGETVTPQDLRTPMYFAAMQPNGAGESIKLLLEKNPQSFDTPNSNWSNETPLMAAVSRSKNAAAVKELVENGASLEKKDSNGKTALDLANALPESANKQAILLALKATPTKGRGGMMTYINNWALYVLGYFNIFKPLATIFGAASKVFYKISAPDGVDPFKYVDEPQTAAEFKNNLNLEVNDNGLQRFFPPGDPYLDELAQKAATLKDDPANPLKMPGQLKGLASLALYQPILYCDDSGSMQDEGRWAHQKDLVKRITDITNRAVPNDKGVHLRFINKSTPTSNNLNGDAVKAKLDEFTPNGGTPIGTSLKSRVLQPLVYDVINKGTQLEKPMLIMITTDGCPSVEATEMFRTNILECSKYLESKKYRKDTVRFCINQIGTDEDAKKFMMSLESDDAVLEVLHRTSELLDKQFEQLKDDAADLEAWLLTMLLSPLQSIKTE